MTWKSNKQKKSIIERRHLSHSDSKRNLNQKQNWAKSPRNSLLQHDDTLSSPSAFLHRHPCPRIHTHIPGLMLLETISGEMQVNENPNDFKSRLKRIRGARMCMSRRMLLVVWQCSVREKEDSVLKSRSPLIKPAFRLFYFFFFFLANSWDLLDCVASGGAGSSNV